MGSYARNVLELFIGGLSLLILARVLVSWTDNGRRSQLSGFLFTATEPILAPIRRVLPQSGMLDLSPMIALVVLSFVLSALH